MLGGMADCGRDNIKNSISMILSKEEFQALGQLTKV